MSVQTGDGAALGALAGEEDQFSPVLLKVLGWCGIAFLVLLAIGWLGLAHFLPPPAPSWSVQKTAHFYIQHRDGVRFGMILTMIGSTLLGPFFAAMVHHIRRIEGRNSPLAWTVLALGAILILEFIYLAFFWETATFRATRPASEIQLLSDMSWIPFLGLTSTVIVGNLAFGWAILTDKRTKPIFPRWLGYFNFYTALLYTPGTFVVFFKHGPLAWNGLLVFYVPLFVFGAWMVVVSLYLVKAVDHQVAERSELAAQTLTVGESNGHSGLETPEAQVIRLSAELSAVTARIETVEHQLQRTSSTT